MTAVGEMPATALSVGSLKAADQPSGIESRHFDAGMVGREVLAVRRYALTRSRALQVFFDTPSNEAVAASVVMEIIPPDLG